MKNWSIYSLLFVSMPLHCSLNPGALAVVSAPVADGCGIRIDTICSNPLTYYKELAHAPDTGAYACLRIHQPIFNELVTIREEGPGGEVAVETPSFFYLDGLHRKRNDFWMLKKDIVPLNSIPQEMRYAIPSPIDYRMAIKSYSQNILTLSRPWYDSVTKRTYSVGTRFVLDPKSDTATGYGIIFFDAQKKSIAHAVVPKTSAVVPLGLSFQESRQIFLKILHEWAYQRNGLIPYVYGGSSFTETAPKKGFSRVTTKKCGLPASYWERHNAATTPCIGFDCSNMILRAAQIAGMPYYFKNTAALTTYLSPLKQGEPLEVGDLVWYSGHVMVVSNLQKNLLIEAVGYESGYGRVHEIPVDEIFTGIKNFDELLHVYHTGHYIRRHKSKGQPWRSIFRLKIFKLSSIVPLTLILTAK